MMDNRARSRLRTWATVLLLTVVLNKPKIVTLTLDSATKSNYSMPKLQNSLRLISNTKKESSDSSIANIKRPKINYRTIRQFTTINTKITSMSWVFLISWLNLRPKE